LGVTRTHENSGCPMGVTRMRCWSQRYPTSFTGSTLATDTEASPHDWAGSYGVSHGAAAATTTSAATIVTPSASSRRLRRGVLVALAKGVRCVAQAAQPQLAQQRPFLGRDPAHLHSPQRKSSTGALSQPAASGRGFESHAAEGRIGTVLASDDYQLARLLIERGLGLLYLIGFVVALVQFPALAGERGLEPAPALLRQLRFADAPSLFQWRYSDRLLRVAALVGTVLALAVVLGVAAALPLPLTMAVWLGLWLLYLSIVNIGGTFYAFGWESQLCETGFLAIFLGNAASAPPFVLLLLFRWLAFRVEFGAGVIKLRGDPCWRALTCMDYHHQTQPLPNPVSWFAHHAPRIFHRLEALRLLSWSQRGLVSRRDGPERARDGAAAQHDAQLISPW